MKMAIEQNKHYPWFVLCVTSLGILLCNLNLSSLNVVLPEVATHFNAGPVGSSWIVLSFMLVNTIFILIFGKVADIFGRRRLYIIGLSLFTIACFFCGLAPSFSVLIIFRVLQALGSALIVSNVTPLITDAFPKETLGIALGLNLLVVSLAFLTGPTLGGYMVVTFNWRWVFWFNVPTGILGILLAIPILKTTSVKTGERVDLPGSVALFIGLGALIMAISQGGVWGWVSKPVLISLTVCLMFLIIFSLIERKAIFPVIDFTLFTDRFFSMAILANFFSLLARSSVTLLMGLFFQVVGRNDSLSAGLKILPIAFGLTVSAPIAGLLTKKMNSRVLSTEGLALSALGIIVLIINISAEPSLTWLFIGQFMVGLGNGFFQTPNTNSIMLSAPINRRGIANGIRSMSQNLGQVVGNALCLAIVTGHLPAHLKNSLYQGAASAVNNMEMRFVIEGYQRVLWFLFLILICAIFASLSKSKEKHPQSGRKYR